VSGRKGMSLAEENKKMEAREEKIEKARRKRGYIVIRVPI